MSGNELRGGGGAGEGGRDLPVPSVWRAGWSRIRSNYGKPLSFGLEPLKFIWTLGRKQYSPAQLFFSYLLLDGFFKIYLAYINNIFLSHRIPIVVHPYWCIYGLNAKQEGNNALLRPSVDERNMKRYSLKYIHGLHCASHEFHET